LNLRISPLLLPPACFLCRRAERRPPPLRAGRRPPPTLPPPHVAPPRNPGPTPFALVPPPLATRPRRASRGCHLAAAVARAAQHPRPSSIARISTPGSSTTRSPRSLARSLPRLPKPAPPSTRNPGELDAAAGPPLQTPSACADPLESSTVGPRSSPTHPPRPIFTGTPRRR